MTDIKEVRISIREHEHDIAVKTKRIEAFLTRGHRVRIRVTMRGREKSRPDVAAERLEYVLSLVSQAKPAGTVRHGMSDASLVVVSK